MWTDISPSFPVLTDSGDFVEVGTDALLPLEVVLVWAAMTEREVHKACCSNLWPHVDFFWLHPLWHDRPLTYYVDTTVLWLRTCTCSAGLLFAAFSGRIAFQCFRLPSKSCCTARSWNHLLHIYGTGCLTPFGWQRLTIMTERRAKLKYRSLERGGSAPHFLFTDSKKPGEMSDSRSDVQLGHDFRKKTFYKPTYCQHCTDLLWGLKGQGFQCTGKVIWICSTVPAKAESVDSCYLL